MWRKKPGSRVTRTSSAFPYGSFCPSKTFQSSFIIILIAASIFVISIFPGALTVEGRKMGDNINESSIPEKLVAGFFNEIDYESSTSETSINVLYNGDTRYKWEYDGKWNGDLDYLDKNGTYYDEEKSSWFVKIAIDHEAPLGDNWTLILNGKEHEIKVVEADTTVGLSGSLEFNFEPYTEGAEVSDSVTLTNDGNVPMTYELTYTDENLIHEAEKDILEAGESISLKFTYQYSPSGPAKLSPEVSLTAEHLGVLDFESEGNIGRKSQPGFGIPTDVLVGYENYKQEKVEDYSVQYKKSISVKGNTYHEVTFYVYPNEDVLIYFNKENVTFKDENVTITALGSDGEELEKIDLDTTAELNSEYDEVEITVEFKSDRENDGSINLKVEKDTYTTKIQLSQTVPEPSEDEISFVEKESETITFGALLIGGVVVFGAARVLLSSAEDKED